MKRAKKVRTRAISKAGSQVGNMMKAFSRRRLLFRSAAGSSRSMATDRRIKTERSVKMAEKRSAVPDAEPRKRIRQNEE